MLIDASARWACALFLGVGLSGCANQNAASPGASPNPFEALIGPLLGDPKRPAAAAPPLAARRVPPPQNRAPQNYARQPQSPAGAQAEAAMRARLLQQAGGFGGIFGPSLNHWANTPSGGGGGGRDECGGRYDEYAAQQACNSGNGWAADRLENRQSDGAEQDWYNR